MFQGGYNKDSERFHFGLVNSAARLSSTGSIDFIGRSHPKVPAFQSVANPDIE